MTRMCKTNKEVQLPFEVACRFLLLSKERRAASREHFGRSFLIRYFDNAFGPGRVDENRLPFSNTFCFLIIVILETPVFELSTLRITDLYKPITKYDNLQLLAYHYVSYNKRIQNLRNNKLHAYHNAAVNASSMYDYLIANVHTLDEMESEYICVNQLVMRKQYLHAVIASLLFGEMAVQVNVPGDLCMLLIDINCVDFSGAHYDAAYDLGKERTTHCYPIKNHRGAQQKVVVSVTDLVRGLVKKDYHLYEYINRRCGYLKGLFNDQVAAILLYCSSTCKILPRSLSFNCALTGVLHIEHAKFINVMIKSLALNKFLPAAACCELNNLRGRGCDELNLSEEVSKRTVPEGCGSVIKFDQNLLYSNIIKILNHEIRYPVEFDDVEHFWEKSWAWCVNGAHSKSFEQYEKKFSTHLEGQIRRRAAIEMYDINPLLEWSGVTYVTALQKLEHGKTRLVLAGDTVSYVCFEHLLKPIERIWSNRRVILDPGSGGHYGIARKVINMCAGKKYLMLDYDDFNSQHSHDSIQTLFRAVCDHVGYDPILGKRLIDSFRRTVLLCDGKRIGYNAGTLCSGHRATTFINTILNAAYIMCAKSDFWDSCSSLHTGDDVIAGICSVNEALEIIKSLREHGGRINPQKQSVGSVAGEFLRMCITSREVNGYAARCVASLISGNWTTDKKLTDDEKINAMVTNAWSLCNRTGNLNACDILALPYAYKLKIAQRLLVKLFNGTAAVGNGPVRLIRTDFERFSIKKEEAPTCDRLDLKVLDVVDSHATDRYLTHCLDPVERSVLATLQISVKKTMLEASYAKSLASLTDDTSTVRFRRLRTVRTIRGGSTDMSNVYCRRVQEGVLATSPVFVYLKNRLSTEHLRAILSAKGICYEPGPQNLSLKEFCFGFEGRNLAIMTPLSYADAASACRRTLSGVLYSDIVIKV